MPNVYKGTAFPEPCRSVKIPDTPRPVPESVQAEEQEPLEEAENAEPQFEPAMPTRLELMDCCREELEDIRREAAQKAYADAFTAKRGDMQALMDKVDKLLQDMQQKQNEFMERFANELRFLAVDIAESLMLAKIDEDDSVLKDLVIHAIGRIHNSEWLDVQVSEQLARLVDTLREEFQRPEYRGRVGVSTKPGPPDMVRVDTQLGAVDASLSRQAENLREIFRNEG